MKIIAILLVVAAMIGVTSCSGKEDINPQEIVNLDGNPNLTRALVESGQFIDVDVKSLAFEVANGGITRSGSNELKEDIAKMKAAVYRFYSNVEVSDGHYVVKVNSGKDLNISESVFEELVNNIDEMNAFIDKVKAKGEDINMFEITQDYLDSLLE